MQGRSWSSVWYESTALVLRGNAYNGNPSIRRQFGSLYIKHATCKACKRFRDGHKVVKDQDMPGVLGHPKKCARVMDMQCAYPDLIA